MRNGLDNAITQVFSRVLGFFELKLCLNINTDKQSPGVPFFEATILLYVITENKHNFVYF